MVTLYIGDEALFVFEEGDLIGTEILFGFADANISAEFAVRADIFERAALFRGICAHGAMSHWTEYLTCRLNAQTVVLAALGKGDRDFSPEIKNYAAGETIIYEETAATDVYTLIQGHADVKVKGVKVGEVLTDEIFGALAALTNTVRTASVVASTHTIVLSLKRDKFLDLMRKRPETVLKMVENMARTIVDLNGRVVALSGGNAEATFEVFAKN